MSAVSAMATHVGPWFAMVITSAAATSRAGSSPSFIQSDSKCYLGGRIWD